MNLLNLDDEVLQDFLANQQSQSVTLMSDFVDRAFEEDQFSGDTLPWMKTWDDFRFRSGELTIWAGVNGNGKSLVMGMTALYLKSPVLIASMEMPGHKTARRMIRQASGSDSPSPAFKDEFNKHTSHIYIYDQLGNVSMESLAAAIRWAATRLDVKHIMIDSLVMCGIDSERNEPQKQFVALLKEIAKRYDIHIHLVHHIRKLEDERRLPDKFDIKGAGEITDLADNVLIVSRNMAKKLDEQSGKPTDENAPDGFIRLAKQRNGEFEGVWGFWWHSPSQQWVPKPNAGAMPFPALWSGAK